MHVIHLTETFQDLSKLKVVSIDSGSIDILEASLVFLDILVEEKFVEIFLCLEMQVGKTMSDGEICVFDLDCSLNVRSPMAFQLLLSFLGLWLSEDVRPENADCIFMFYALPFHEFHPFFLLVI